MRFHLNKADAAYAWCLEIEARTGTVNVITRSNKPTFCYLVLPKWNFFLTSLNKGIGIDIRTLI